LDWRINLPWLNLLWQALVLVGAFHLSASATIAKVFHSKQEALAIAFPGADRVETRTFFLTDEQVKQVTALASAPVDSKLVTFYIGYTNGQVSGYAAIDTNLVRTLPETFLIVLSPTGEVQKLLLLAFYEPEEYSPSERWLQQFERKPLGPELNIRRDIHGIAGSTLTSRAVTNGVRRTLALFQTLFPENK
jgi:hypothetical protein